MPDGTRKEPLPGAVVFAPAQGMGTAADSTGRFSISLPDTALLLVVSYEGWMPDTINLKTAGANLEIQLHPLNDLDGVEVRERMRSTEIGLSGAMKIERLGLGELYKAACCNLSSSFETTPSVDVAYTDAVTGYRQIRLLGLAGTYTLITQENIPMVRGLASIAGLTYIPGAWMEGIQLSKGTGSVVNGYESVAGQINVELKKPFAGEKLFINLYQSSQGNTQADFVYRANINRKLSSVLFLDGAKQWLKVDLNRDHFIDQPLGNFINIMNRWIYVGDNGLMFQAGVKVLYTDGVGGDWNYKAGEPQVPGNPWGYQATTERLEDWAKVAKTFTARDETSIGLQYGNVEHDQNSQYGQNTYTGRQSSFYANLIFQTYLFDTKNIIKTGVSEVLDMFDEQLLQQTAQQNYTRFESVPGVFGEYSGNFSEKFNLVAGLRADFDNLYGPFLTPRLHLRYAPFKRTALRFSVGRAQRTANIFADNIGYLASNRQVDILNPVAGKPYGLNPEVAWNTGLNITHKFKFRYHEGVISADAYYTRFQSQVVVDVNYPQILNFYNLQGTSYSQSAQIQFDYELLRRLNIRLAYRYNNVMTDYYEVGLQEKPFQAKNKAFGNLSYETRSKWKFDYTLQWVGEERTPYAEHNHGGTGIGINSFSAPFYQMNTQITKVFTDKFEVYLGGDNLTNFMQHDAIVDYDNPYARNFDASMIWGPMMGVNVYVGMRLKVM